MSTHSKPYYWLTCDDCGVKSTMHSDYAAWAEVDEAEQEALDSDWVFRDGHKHYCEPCAIRLGLGDDDQ